MIDERFQGKGYAPQILDEVMKLVRTYPYGPAEYIWLSYEPENIHGKNIYRKYGFRENGEMCDDEIITEGVRCRYVLEQLFQYLVEADTRQNNSCFNKQISHFFVKDEFYEKFKGCGLLENKEMVNAIIDA